MSADSYLTIDRIYDGIVREKGSRFLSFAHPVSTHEQAKQLLDNYRKNAQYKGACHFCYAYVLAGDESRSSDDGEPSGTAGKPILNQLIAQHLRDVLVVVIRFFGGTLLGTSGLIKAYKEAAIACLHEIESVEIILRKPLTIRFPYPLQSEVERATKPFDIKVENKNFSHDVAFTLMIRQGEFNAVERILSKLHEVQIVDSEAFH